MNAFLVVLEVRPMQVGRVYDSLALHCTVVHWFYAPASASQVLKSITSVIAHTAPLELTAGRKDLFGPSRGPRNVPVNHVDPTPQFRLLHARLLRALESLCIHHTEPAYLGEGFNPHVTKQGNMRFIEGSRYETSAAYLVEALDAQNLKQKRISAKLLLGTSLSSASLRR